MHGSPETSVTTTTPASSSTTIATAAATASTSTASNYATAAVASEASASPSALHSPLQHQSKSFPPRLNRTPSISSQSSIDSTPTRQSVNDIILFFRQSLFFRFPANLLNYHFLYFSNYKLIMCRHIVAHRHKFEHLVQMDGAHQLMNNLYSIFRVHRAHCVPLA